MIIQEIILKVTSNCNLNCSYCYVYNKGDLSHEKEPNYIDIETLEKLFEKLNAYAKEANVKRMLIILHGGEPLILKKDFYTKLVSISKKYSDNVLFDFALQTNATLLNDEWSEFFMKINIKVGISLDGTEEGSKKRVFKNGDFTYQKTVEGLKTYQNYNPNVGILSVVNTETSPKLVYENIKNLKLTHASFLFLDENYDTFKSLPKNEVSSWLIELFDLWFNDSDKSRPYRILPFNIIIDKVIGIENAGNELLGQSKNSVIVIKTNGDIDLVDTLKVCGDGFTKTGLNIETNGISDIFKNKYFKLYYNSHSDEFLCNQCKSCEIKEICGGGYLPHRFSRKNGFDNPSVYCNDLKLIIKHVQNTIIDSLPNDVVMSCNLSKIEI